MCRRIIVLYTKSILWCAPSIVVRDFELLENSFAVFLAFLLHREEVLIIRSGIPEWLTHRSCDESVVVCVALHALALQRFPIYVCPIDLRWFRPFIHARVAVEAEMAVTVEVIFVVWSTFTERAKDGLRDACYGRVG